MKIKSLILVAIVLMVIILNLKISFALPITPQKLPEFDLLEEFLDKAFKSELLRKKPWTKTDLHDKLPDRIKSILEKYSQRR